MYSKHVVCNYSLTCIIASTILLDLYQVFSDVQFEVQFGFHIKHSTTLLLLMEWTLISIDDSLLLLLIVCSVIDFVEAFNSVCHQRLLLKLEAFGVHGSTL